MARSGKCSKILGESLKLSSEQSDLVPCVPEIQEPRPVEARTSEAYLQVLVMSGPHHHWPDLSAPQVLFPWYILSSDPQDVGP